MTTLAPPELRDVLAARERIRPHLPPTPFLRSPALSAAVGTEVWVKHENLQPVGAFKVRGGVNLAAALAEQPGGPPPALACASTGNHGQSVAYAAQLLGVPAVVHVPAGANPLKVASMERLGATVVSGGRDFDEARERCEREAHRLGQRYVHSGDEPLLIAGVATEAVEILEADPPVDVIIVPVGGGSGAAGVCLATSALRPEVEVIGVQSSAAPAAYRSWQARQLLEDRCATFAEGLATRTAFSLPQQILWRLLGDFVLVDDDAIRAAMVAMLEGTRTLAEGAGAAPLAAALQLRERLHGRRVALVCSGGNVPAAQLAGVLASAG